MPFSISERPHPGARTRYRRSRPLAGSAPGDRSRPGSLRERRVAIAFPRALRAQGRGFGFWRAYQQFKDEPGFTRVATLPEIWAKDGYLSIPIYVSPATNAQEPGGKYSKEGLNGVEHVIDEWLKGSRDVRNALQTLLSAKKN